MPPAQISHSFTDLFPDVSLPGQVIGRTSPDGLPRKGIDVEGIIGIDNSALRIQSLTRPGWGRAGLAYGPYRRENGLTLGVLILNGHNASQAGGLMQSFIRRVGRWSMGSGAERFTLRMAKWIRNGRKSIFLRQLKRWFWLSRAYSNGNGPVLDENLAVGWFSAQAPGDPLKEGSCFLVHGTDAENSELWTRSAGGFPAVLRGLQNIPIYFLIMLREKGAAYYAAAALPNTPGLPIYPLFRPLAVEPYGDNLEVYAGIHQSVMGQVGFRVDTRVHGVTLEKLPEFGNWFGTAHVADAFNGEGQLGGSIAEAGGAWIMHSGSFQRQAQGLSAEDSDNFAVLYPRDPSGIINLIYTLNDAAANGFSLRWRIRDVTSYWDLYINIKNKRCSLRVSEQGEQEQVASVDLPVFANLDNHCLQVVDQGTEFEIFLNGESLFDGRLLDSRLAGATGLGFYQAEPNQGICLKSLEAHQRTINMAEHLSLPKVLLKQSGQTVVEDDFEGLPADLSGHKSNVAKSLWRKEMGQGSMKLAGTGAVKVDASLENPNPGRTVYTIPWNDTTFADVQVEITPPGSARGQNHGGRGGIIFWQDAENYLIINNWLSDVYQGASISSFFMINGFEDIYDAVWTNVGKRVYWGRPHLLRVKFDGQVFVVSVDDEPVLYRSLRDIYPDVDCIAIRRVGIVANWEWGDDTGSIFRQFKARGKER
jgi:hypothetical protein